ncbi:MAG: DNA-binding response regulator [Flavobacteriia bacterium]|nr:MAG: DNA-binding response regulator [Flavobacteriia bacterium]
MAHKTIIIDDELLARKRIMELLTDRNEFDVIAECHNGEDAIGKINELSPDVIFLDIELKGMTGFDVLRNIHPQKMPIVVFATAYDYYAVDAFNNYALDFLLKPFKNKRFHETLERILERMQHLDYEERMKGFLDSLDGNLKKGHGSNTKKLPIKQDNKTIFLNTDQVKYVCASSYYAEIYIGEKKYVVRDSLKNLLHQLTDHQFIRIHRSTIINVDHILELVHSDYNEIDIRMNDLKLFRISKSYRKDTLTKLGIL